MESFSSFDRSTEGLVIKHPNYQVKGVDGIFEHFITNILLFFRLIKVMQLIKVTQSLLGIYIFALEFLVNKIYHTENRAVVR